MGKRAMEEMLLLDHQDRALGGKLAHMFMPLLQAALGKQLWEISTNRQEMSPHLRELLEALREVDLNTRSATARKRIGYLKCSWLATCCAARTRTNRTSCLQSLHGGNRSL